MSIDVAVGVYLPGPAFFVEFRAGGHALAQEAFDHLAIMVVQAAAIAATGCPAGEAAFIVEISEGGEDTTYGCTLRVLDVDVGEGIPPSQMGGLTAAFLRPEGPSHTFRLTLEDRDRSGAYRIAAIVPAAAADGRNLNTNARAFCMAAAVALAAAAAPAAPQQ